MNKNGVKKSINQILKFKKRDKVLKKVLIYGEDGTGKSTYAEQYCIKNKLNPVVIDVEDTNFTKIGKEKSLDIKFTNDKVITREIVQSIKEVSESEYDTIIIDGVSTLLERLVSKQPGLRKYSDRAENFQKILDAALTSGLNVIFIGQIDMKVVMTEDSQSNKQIIKINALINEKYLCKKENGKYVQETQKFRGE